MRARFINEVFDVLTWSKNNMEPAIYQNICDAHCGKYGEKVQKSLLKCQSKDDLLQWHNRTFEIGELHESETPDDVSRHFALKGDDFIQELKEDIDLFIDKIVPLLANRNPSVDEVRNLLIQEIEELYDVEIADMDDDRITAVLSLVDAAAENYVRG